jgi:hypothetical protein
MPSIAKVTVDWNSAGVDAKIADELSFVLDALAFEIQNEAERNIEDNHQIDTGFLHDTGYIITPLHDTFGAVPSGGQYVSSKTGVSVWRLSRAKPPAPQRKKSAIVGFAADYALYPELQNSYLYRAIDSINTDEIIRRVVSGAA